jgi:hypothetical protein
MAGSCALLISMVCFRVMGAVEHPDEGGHATVTGSGFVAVIDSDDAAQPPNWRLMNESCNEGKCLRYFKHCVTTSSTAVCDYYFGQPGDSQAQHLQLSVSWSYARIANRIFLMAAGKSEDDGIALPLSWMLIDSGNGGLPRCLYEQKEWCNP